MRAQHRTISFSGSAVVNDTVLVSLISIAPVRKRSLLGSAQIRSAAASPLEAKWQLAYQHTSCETNRSCLNVFRFATGPKISMGHLLGPKKYNSGCRGDDDATMAAAPVESCQFVARRSSWARLGSLLDVGNRLPRMRGHSHL